MKFLGVPSSGSLQGETNSHNRFGQYVRSRSTPVNPNTTQQGIARARLAQTSAAWRLLTPNQRTGWDSLGLQMTRTDSLGQTYTLTGSQAYSSVNSTRLAAGDAVVSDAPAVTTPVALTSVTLTLTAAAFSIAYTPTPLATGQRLFTFTSPGRSAGRSFESDYRLLAVSAAAAASPANVFAAFSARFGIPVVGQRVFLQLHVYELGFLSGPLVTSQVVA